MAVNKRILLFDNLFIIYKRKNKFLVQTGLDSNNIICSRHGLFSVTSSLICIYNGLY